MVFRAESSAQQSADRGPRQTMNAVFEKSNLMTALSGYGWRPGLNLAAARLEVGRTISLNVALKAGVEYVFLASGPDELADVDLYLRDTDGRVLAEDLEDDGTPVVEFTATRTATYQLQLHLAAGESAAAYVALSILRRGGHQVIEQAYHGTTAGFFAAADRLLLPDTGARWQKQEGTWCLFGFSLQEKQGASLQNLQPNGKKTFFAAAGQKATQINLYLADDNDRIVAMTDRPEPYPLLSHQTVSNAVYDLRIETTRARTHKLVLLGVFEK